MEPWCLIERECHCFLRVISFVETFFAPACVHNGLGEGGRGEREGVVYHYREERRERGGRWIRR